MISCDYIGKWVALDDKDRIISIAKNRKDLLEDIIVYEDYLNNHGVKVYKLMDKDNSNIIRCLLGDIKNITVFPHVKNAKNPI